MIEHLEIGRSGYFYRRKRRLTNEAIDRLFRSLRTNSQQPSQNLFRIDREQFGAVHYSAICFSYERNSSFLEPAAGAIELVLGGLLMIGLLTRISAFLLSGQMAFAYFLGHVFKTGTPVWHPLNNGGTGAALFCFVCLYLASAGPGPWSVDASRGKA